GRAVKDRAASGPGPGRDRGSLRGRARHRVRAVFGLRAGHRHDGAYAGRVPRDPLGRGLLRLAGPHPVRLGGLDGRLHGPGCARRARAQEVQRSPLGGGVPVADHDPPPRRRRRDRARRRADGARGEAGGPSRPDRRARGLPRPALRRALRRHHPHLRVEGGAFYNARDARGVAGGGLGPRGRCPYFGGRGLAAVLVRGLPRDLALRGGGEPPGLRLHVRGLRGALPSRQVLPDDPARHGLRRVQGHRPRREADGDGDQHPHRPRHRRDCGPVPAAGQGPGAPPWV
ncbi:MAG: hypothetical protein AVDCRST_MAG02-1044, partial [uncultured Rubrobacteraceae bacterium]